MKIFLFYTAFFIVIYLIFPRIGTSKYVDESRKLNPICGLDRHYRYDPNLCRFHWGMIFIGYSILIIIFAGVYLGILKGPRDENYLFWFIFAATLISLPCVPYAILLLSLKYNSKAGVYIYKDRIVCIGRFYNQTIYKKDIEHIEFRGILWGFVIKKKNSKKDDYIMVMTKDLPQQISTLSKYLEMHT